MEWFVLLSIEVKSWRRSSDHTCNISASLPNCRLGRGPYQLIFRSNVPINPRLHQFQGHPLVHSHKRYNWTSQGRRHQTLTVRQYWKFYSCLVAGQSASFISDRKKRSCFFLVCLSPIRMSGPNVTKTPSLFADPSKEGYNCNKTWLLLPSYCRTDIICPSTLR